MALRGAALSQFTSSRVDAVILQGWGEQGATRERGQHDALLAEAGDAVRHGRRVDDRVGQAELIDERVLQGGFQEGHG